MLNNVDVGVIFSTKIKCIAAMFICDAWSWFLGLLASLDASFVVTSGVIRTIPIAFALGHPWHCSNTDKNNLNERVQNEAISSSYISKQGHALGKTKTPRNAKQRSIYSCFHD